MDAESKNEATTGTDATVAKELTTASHEEIIKSLAEAKECSVDSIGSDLETEVKALTSPQLVQMWWRLWNDTPRAFCKLMQINGGNFSCWLRGRKSSPTSANAVREWLVKLWKGELGTNYPCCLNNTQLADEQQCDNVFKKIFEQNKVMTDLKDVPRVVLDRVPQGLDTVVFVDVENGGHVLRGFNPESAPNTHIVITLRRGLLHWTASQTARVHSSHVSLVSTKTIMPDAADSTITILMAMLSVSLPESVAFYLVTNDHFAGEVCAQLSTQRVCHWIDHKLDRAFDFKRVQDFIRVGPSASETHDDYAFEASFTPDEIKALKDHIANAKGPVSILALHQLLKNLTGRNGFACIRDPKLLRALDAQVFRVRNPDGTGYIAMFVSNSLPYSAYYAP
jgi:hypothetical protein